MLIQSDFIGERTDSVRNQPEPLSEFVQKVLHHYFEHLEGEMPKDLYALVLKEMEKGFFTVLMEKAGYNQVLASKMSGLARNTLRKKLKELNLEHIKETQLD